VMVLAAADTPAAILDSLADETGSTALQPAAFETTTALESGAVQARIYALMAGFCLVVALLVLASSVARERAVHQRETAALRIVGVGVGAVRGSGRRELGALAVAALVATVAGALAGVELLLGNLTLVTVPLHAPPLEIGLAAVPVAIAAVAAAAIVLVVGGRARAVRSDQARPALLREDD
jgi:hypothetical protein